MKNFNQEKWNGQNRYGLFSASSIATNKEESPNSAPFLNDFNKLTNQINIDISALDFSQQIVKRHLSAAQEYFAKSDFFKAQECYIEALYIAKENCLCFKRTDDYLVITQCLTGIADISFNLAKNITQNDENKNSFSDNLIKANMFYNAAFSILTRYVEASEADAQHLKLIEKMTAVQSLYIEKITGKVLDEDVCGKDMQYKTKWEVLRKNAELGLNNIDEVKIIHVEDHEGFYKRAEAVNKVYLSIQKDIRELLIMIITDCQQLLDNLLTEFEWAVILFGSLAKQSATPYSDIEFGILVNDSKYKDDCRSLAYLLAIKIINLGQTLVPADMLQAKNGKKVILDDFLTPGFQFDLGGKTPLGRKDHSYDLIATPMEMADCLKDKNFLVDKLLPIELSNFSYLYGSERLATEYSAQVSLFMEETVENKKRYFKRGVEILLIGYPGLACDFEKYSIDIDMDETIGRLYDVKKEIYRLPDRIIDDLGLIFNIKSSSNWERIEKLFCNDAKTVKNLRIVDAISKEIRLRTYLSNKSQREKVSIFSPTDRAVMRQVFHITDISLMLRFYSSILPIYEQIGIYRDKPDKLCLLLDSSCNKNFFSKRAFYRGIVYRRFLKNEDALVELRKAAEEEPNNIHILHFLGSFLSDIDYQEATAYLNKALSLAKTHSKHDLSVINIFISIHAHQARQIVDRETNFNSPAILKLIKEMENLINQLHSVSENNSSDAEMRITKNLAGLYLKLGYYEQTKFLLEKILPFEEKSNKNFPNYTDSHKASNYGNMSHFLMKIGEPEEEQQTKLVGESLLKLGCLLRKQGKYKIAYTYLNRALEIFNGLRSQLNKIDFHELGNELQLVAYMIFDNYLNVDGNYGLSAYQEHLFNTVNIKNICDEQEIIIPPTTDKLETICLDIAAYLFNNRETDASISFYEKARHYGPYAQSCRLGVLLYAKASRFLEKNDLAQYQILLEKTQKIFSTAVTFEQNHPKFGCSISIQFANYLCREKNYSKAIEVLEKILNKNDLHFTRLWYDEQMAEALDSNLKKEVNIYLMWGIEFLDIIYAYYLLVEAYCATSQLDKANNLIPRFAKAIEVYKKAEDKKAYSCKHYTLIGYACKTLKRYDDAAEYFKKSFDMSYGDMFINKNYSECQNLSKNIKLASDDNMEFSANTP